MEPATAPRWCSLMHAALALGAVLLAADAAAHLLPARTPASSPAAPAPAPATATAAPAPPRPPSASAAGEAAAVVGGGGGGGGRVRYARWDNAAGGEEAVRRSAWEAGGGAPEDGAETFAQWRARCTAAPPSRRGFKRYNKGGGAAEQGSLCYAPLKYHERRARCAATVGLFSIEGHGNHATRWLLEQATGVASGSIYGDAEHVKRFGAEQAKKDVLGAAVFGRGIVVKSHKVALKEAIVGDHPPVKHRRTIQIVRGPLGGILANYQRIGHALKDPCSDSKGTVGLQGDTHHSRVEDWDSPRRRAHFTKYAQCQARRYVKGLRHKLESPPAGWKFPVLTVRYEDLVQDTEWMLRLLLAFLGVPLPEPPMLECAVRISRGTKREHPEGEADPWDPALEARRKVLEAEGMCEVLRAFWYDELAEEACTLAAAS